MWILYAFFSAFFAGITSILAKCGIKKTDSTLATAIRTIVVLIFSWLMVYIVGSFDQIYTMEFKTFLFLILSGLCTGASWLCYFKALQIGDINKVVPIDKSSTILTIILAFLLLHESVTWTKMVGILFIGAGTFLMIEKKQISNVETKGNQWIFYALGAAVFASLTSGNSNSYQRCLIDVLDHGFCHKETIGNPQGIKKGMDLYCFIRIGYRGFLAVLLQSFTGWIGQCSGSY